MAYYWWRDRKFLFWMLYNLGTMTFCAYAELPPLIWFLFMFLPFFLYDCLVRWLTKK